MNDELTDLIDKHLSRRFANGSTPVTMLDRLRRLNEIGIALSAQRDIQLLLEMILFSAKELTNADGGTLYRKQDDNLEFVILANDSLQLHAGGSSEFPITLPAVPLHLPNGQPNRHNIAAHAALEGKTVNISDSRKDENFDFSGTRAFDQQMKYESVSFLSVPIIDHQQNVISVLQLINARSHRDGRIEAFSENDQQLVESLASQAAVALSNRQLMEDQKNLFESFIELIAGAIDDKSPYTGGHCRRVPELTMMLAQATIDTQVGPMSEFTMDDDEFYALKIAGWLHDCGKIITPEHVVDKATKLQTIHDRIHEVDTRFEVLRRDARINYLETLSSLDVADQDGRVHAEQTYQATLQQLEEDRDFIRQANIGREFISDEDRERINRIAEYRWQGPDDEAQPLLSAEEVYNLHIARGTLTAEERAVINGHMSATIKMLEALPYPDHLANVPEYAGGHHEKMDGTGYPRGLTREQMSVPARIMGIADIFEAITARDRPYREGIKLSEALNLMGTFRLNDHIDPDLFDVFIREKVYQQYAELFMAPEQIDEVDENTIRGYTPPA